jgi:hypothetical protein
MALYKSRARANWVAKNLKSAARAEQDLYAALYSVRGAYDNLVKHPDDRSYQLALQARVAELLRPYSLLLEMAVPAMYLATDDVRSA